MPGTSARKLSYARAFRAARLGMAIGTPNGVGPRTLLEVNAAFAALFGYTREQMVGMDTHDLTHPDDAARTADAARRLGEGLTETMELEKRYVRSDGSVFWGAVHVSLVHDEDGTPEATIVHVVDIDDRKQAELKLARSREQLEATQRHGHTGSFELLPSGTLVASNQLLRMAGKSPHARPDAVAKALDNVHPEDRDKVWGVLLRPDRARTIEFRYLHHGGRYLDVEMITAPVLDDLGEPSGLRGIVHDISHRRALETALDSAERIRSAFDASPVPQVLLADDDTGLHVEYVNGAAEQLLGRPKDELLGLPLETTFPGATLPPLLATALSAVNGVGAQVVEVATREGLSIPVAAEVRPLPALDAAKQSFLVALHTSTARRVGPAEELPALTDRERDVLQLVAEGRSGGEIAEALFVSAETVKTHLRRVYAKLAVSDRAAAVAVALRAGIIR